METDDVLVCRLCAEQKSDNNLIELTDERAITLNLVEKIVYNYSIEISDEDILPKHICTSCCDKVCNHYEFRELVLRSQQLLSNRMVQIKQEHFEFSSENKNHFDDDFFSDTKMEYDSDESSDDIPLSKKTNIPFIAEEKECLADDSKKTNLGVKKCKWKCTECDDTFRTEKKLRNHCLTKHNTAPVYSCKDCGKEYKNYESFLSHKRIHRKSCVCDICGKNCRDGAHLKLHLQTHSDVTPFQCEECNKEFKSPKALESHKKSHLPNELKKKFECEICDKKFTTKAHLNIHKESHNSTEPERNYVCEQCGRNFRQKANLKQHMSTHLDIFPFTCDKCPKAFKNVYSLRRHQKNHLDYELFKCEVCLRQFRHKRALKRHANIHTNKLPYECEHCHKCFREKSYLKIHLRQHTGEKPYSCIECNHYFTNDSNFIKHLKGRHGLDNFSVANQRQYPFVNYGQTVTPYMKYETTANLTPLKYEAGISAAMKYENSANISSV